MRYREEKAGCREILYHLLPIGLTDSADVCYAPPSGTTHVTGQFLAYIAKDFERKNNSAAEIGDVLGGDTNATEAAMCNKKKEESISVDRVI